MLIERLGKIENIGTTETSPGKTRKNLFATSFVAFQGWKQWILALDVRKNGLRRQAGKFPGHLTENSRKCPGNFQ